MTAPLVKVRSDRADVVSCYVRVDPAARTRQRYLVDIKQRAKDLVRHLAAVNAPEIDRIQRDIARIVTWLGTAGNLPAGPGVAIFACHRLNLFTVVPLPRVHRNRIGVSRAPMLHGVIDAREALGHYLAVVVDRVHGRLFEVDADGAVELAGIVPVGRRGGKFHSDRRDAPGWGERDYHHRLTTEAHRHYARIADAVRHAAASRPIAGVAVLGPREHCLGVADFLPRKIPHLGDARVNPKSATPAEVAQATWLLREKFERRGEADLVAAVEEGVATGSAVNGVHEVLRALARGQVRAMVIPERQTGGGFRCQSTGRLVLARGECRGEGDAEPVLELVDAAIDEALHQRADVVIVDDPDIGGRIDGMAALLRYRDR